MGVVHHHQMKIHTRTYIHTYMHTYTLHVDGRRIRYVRPAGYGMLGFIIRSTLYSNFYTALANSSTRYTNIGCGARLSMLCARVHRLIVFTITLLSPVHIHTRSVMFPFAAMSVKELC